jgi:ubiquinone/menaquinone biosynthesis C-methylase UbiE
MGRYSRPLASAFADAAGVQPGQRALDVGCGPGALTRELIDRLGAGAVAACDPSAPFVADCGAAYPGIDLRVGRAEAIPFDVASFDIVLAQLVLHFVSDPAAAAAEFRRVLSPGGTAAACVWDLDKEMEMLRHFWDAALAIETAVPDGERMLRFGRRGEIADWLVEGGFVDVEETTLEVSSTYVDFDELWSGFLAGIGPAGSFCLSLTDDRRAALRTELFGRIGSPSGPFTLSAIAISARGRAPG